MTMLYVGIGSVVVSTGVSLYSGNQAANNAANNQSQISNAEGDAIAKSNMSQIVRNSYRTGMLNMQYGLQKKKAVQEGFDLTVQAEQMSGAAGANIAASGTVGSSADAVLQSIDMKLGEAQAQGKDNFEMVVNNYENELESMRLTAMNNVVDARQYQYNGPSQGQMVGGAILGAAVNFGSMYVQRQMSLGLGPKVGSTTAVTGGLSGGAMSPVG